MLKISVKVDIDRLAPKCRAISDEVRQKATVRALNRTAENAKTEASREIRAAGYKLKAAVVKKNITITRASPSELRAVVRAVGRPVGLINYGARQTSKGVSVDVKNGRKVIPHTFIARMPNGHVGVYFRRGKSHKKVGSGPSSWHGLPIDELFGPSIPSAFLNEVVQRNLKAAVRRKFPEVFKREVSYLQLKGRA